MGTTGINANVIKQALVEILKNIYEADFSGFSDGLTKVSIMDVIFSLTFLELYSDLLVQRAAGRLPENSARSEDCEKLRIKISASEENSGAIWRRSRNFQTNLSQPRDCRDAGAGRSSCRVGQSILGQPPGSMPPMSRTSARLWRGAS